MIISMRSERVPHPARRHLSYNVITEIVPGAFAGLVNLTVLCVCRHCLFAHARASSSSDMSFLLRVEKAQVLLRGCSFNRMTTFPPVLFSGLGALREL